MSEKINKTIICPIDGSSNAKKALKYLSHMYESSDSVTITLCYILPDIPPLFANPDITDELLRYIGTIKDKNIQMALKILNEGKEYLEDWGFVPEQIKTVYRNFDVGVARDICRYAKNEKADAIVLATLGRSRLEAFFMGKISHNVLEYSKNVPVWIVNGSVTENKILIGIDPSDNALKAVEHAGLMLSETDFQVTLFHTYGQLRRFLPKEVLEAAPISELEKIWFQMAGHEITPYLEKAKEILLEAGLKEEQISIKAVDGSRSAAADILNEARKNRCGTIILGRRGSSLNDEVKIGSVTRKVLHDSKGLTVWVL